MAVTISGLPEEDLSQKRQLIYASLLRYAPEAAPLRERVFDRLVIAALLGSEDKKPYRVGTIQSNIVFGANIPQNLRVERVHESLASFRLTVKSTTLRSARGTRTTLLPRDWKNSRRFSPRRVTFLNRSSRSCLRTRVTHFLVRWGVGFAEPLYLSALPGSEPRWRKP